MAKVLRSNFLMEIRTAQALGALKVKFQSLTEIEQPREDVAYIVINESDKRMPDASWNGTTRDRFGG